jgi:hypothetical protein
MQQRHLLSLHLSILSNIRGLPRIFISPFRLDLDLFERVRSTVIITVTIIEYPSRATDLHRRRVSVSSSIDEVDHSLARLAWTSALYYNHNRRYNRISKPSHRLASATCVHFQFDDLLERVRSTIIIT